MGCGSTVAPRSFFSLFETDCRGGNAHRPFCMVVFTYPKLLGAGLPCNWAYNYPHYVLLSCRGLFSYPQPCKICSKISSICADFTSSLPLFSNRELDAFWGAYAAKCNIYIAVQSFSRLDLGPGRKPPNRPAGAVFLHDNGLVWGLVIFCSDVHLGICSKSGAKKHAGAFFRRNSCLCRQLFGN